MKQDLSLKIRLIYLPYLLIIIAILIILTSLRFLFSEHWQILNINSSIWNLYLPLTIAITLVLRYLRPRLRILGLGKNNNGFIMYNLITIASIVMPAHYAQQYVSTAPHKLHRLKSLNDIDTNNVQKYYTADNYRFDGNGAMSALSWVSGSFKNNIQYTILTASPMYDSIHGQFKTTYWYAYAYDTTVVKSINRAKAEKAIEDFIMSVRRKYDDFKPKEHIYF